MKRLKEGVVLVGVDMSMNSTGLCIVHGDTHRLFHIVSDVFDFKFAHFATKLDYERCDRKDLHKDIETIFSARALTETIWDAINTELGMNDLRSHKLYIGIEGVALGIIGSSSAMELAEYQTIFKSAMISKCVSIQVPYPSHIKSVFAKYGGGSKEAVGETYFAIYPDHKPATKSEKVDDVIDAYAICVTVAQDMGLFEGMVETPYEQPKKTPKKTKKQKLAILKAREEAKALVDAGRLKAKEAMAIKKAERADAKAEAERVKQEKKESKLKK